MTKEKNGAKKYQGIEHKKIEKSQVEVSGEITAEAFEEHYSRALKEVVAHTELPGFRAGKAPESMVVKQVGEAAIVDRAARSAIDEIFPEIVEELGLRAIDAPSIVITKIARNNPLGFKAQVVVMPEVVLPEYKKIAADVAHVKDDVEVSEKEIDEVLHNLQHIVAQGEGHGHTHNHGEHDHSEEAHAHLPEINDDFAQKIGEYKTVAELKEAVVENVKGSKKRELKERRRGEIAEKLIAAATIDVPEIFIESELESMMHRFKTDVEKAGATWNEYLKEIKKTEDDIKKEWRDNAEKKAKLELILGHIAREENIVPSEEEVKKGVDEIAKRHAQVDRFNARMHVERVLRNSATLDFLEKQGE